MSAAQEILIRKLETAETGAELHQISIGSIKFLISPELFQPVQNERLQKQLFKALVSRVTIEISSYCNRRCFFCPNTTGGRLQEKNYMADDMFESIVGELGSIEYDKGLIFHLYNEPMADPNVVKRVRAARAKLPKARIWFNTNGDYIDYSLVRELIGAGLDTLAISLYGPNHGQFDKDYIANRIAEIREEIQLTDTADIATDSLLETSGFVEHETGRVRIRIFAQDYGTTGYDRGGLLDVGIRGKRSTPCATVFNEFLVTWSGQVVPCCNVYADDPDHADYVIGNLNDGGSIYEHYCGDRLAAWRKGLIKFSSYAAPCTNCSRADIPSLGNKEEIESYNKSVDAMIGVEAK